MGVLRYSYGIPIGFLWDFFGISTSSTAQGGGGSFKKETYRLVVVNQGWQSEATDGLKGA